MGKHLENHAKIIHNQRTEGGIEPGTPLPFLRLGGGWGGGFDLINQALGFDLGRKKHLLSQEELQLATLAFVKTPKKAKQTKNTLKHSPKRNHSAKGKTGESETDKPSVGPRQFQSLLTGVQTLQLVAQGLEGQQAAEPALAGSKGGEETRRKTVFFFNVHEGQEELLVQHPAVWVFNEAAR